MPPTRPADLRFGRMPNTYERNARERVPAAVGAAPAGAAHPYAEGGMLLGSPVSSSDDGRDVGAALQWYMDRFNRVVCAVHEAADARGVGAEVRAALDHFGIKHAIVHPCWTLFTGSKLLTGAFAPKWLLPDTFTAHHVLVIRRALGAYAAFAMTAASWVLRPTDDIPVLVARVDNWMAALLGRGQWAVEATKLLARHHPAPAAPVQFAATPEAWAPEHAEAPPDAAATAAPPTAPSSPGSAASVVPLVTTPKTTYPTPGEHALQSREWLAILADLEQALAHVTAALGTVFDDVEAASSIAFVRCSLLVAHGEVSSRIGVQPLPGASQA